MEKCEHATIQRTVELLLSIPHKAMPLIIYYYHCYYYFYSSLSYYYYYHYYYYYSYYYAYAMPTLQ